MTRKRRLVKIDLSDYPSVEPGLWQLWIEHRASEGRPVSRVSGQLQLEMLNTLAAEQQKAVVLTSVRNGWLGLFPERVQRVEPVRPKSTRDMSMAEMFDTSWADC